MTKQIEINEKFEVLFEKAKNKVFCNEKKNIRKMRQQAFHMFKQQGIPSLKDENYKYTNLQTVLNKDFQVALHKPKKSNIKILQDPNYSILLQNGWLLTHNIDNKNIHICNINEAAKNFPKIFPKFFSEIAQKYDGIASLNAMLSAGGLFIYIPPNLILEKAVHIKNELVGENDTLINSQVLIVAEKNTQVKFILQNQSTENVALVNNQLVDIQIAENANVEYYMLQNNNNASGLNSVFVEQQTNSHFKINTISLSGKTIRNNLHISLNGEFCESELNGFYYSDENQHTDNFTIVDHKRPHCISREHYKGVIREQGSAAFCGRIHVFRNAQKTKAYQTNNNLLLDKNAVVNSRPQLIIDADDVKCSHGATVGQMDETALFYLRARGISENEARKMLINAFAAEITDKISINTLKNKITKIINRKLARNDF